MEPFNTNDSFAMPRHHSRREPDILPLPAATTAETPAKLTDRLISLAELHDNGSLTDEEFEVAKRRLLESTDQAEEVAALSVRRDAAIAEHYERENRSMRYAPLVTVISIVIFVIIAVIMISVFNHTADQPQFPDICVTGLPSVSC